MTAQVHETLILNGQQTSMASEPTLPKNDPRIIRLNDQEIDFEQEDGIIFSTACWREYIGTWEIKDNHLYLVDIAGRYKLLDNHPILADWVTDELIVPIGEILQYVHMGYGSLYEQELHIQIQNGVVVNSVTVDNRNEYS